MIKQNEIKSCVADAFGISMHELMFGTKNPHVFARAAAMKICHDQLGASYNTLKKWFKKRGHNTCMKSVKLANDMIDTRYQAFVPHYKLSLRLIEELELMKVNKQRYNLHYGLRDKGYTVHPCTRSVSIPYQMEAPKQAIKLANKHRYSLQLSIL